MAATTHIYPVKEDNTENGKEYQVRGFVATDDLVTYTFDMYSDTSSLVTGTYLYRQQYQKAGNAGYMFTWILRETNHSG